MRFSWIYGMLKFFLTVDINIEFVQKDEKLYDNNSKSFDLKN